MTVETLELINHALKVATGIITLTQKILPEQEDETDEK